MNKRIKTQTSQLDLNIAKAGCRMTDLPINGVYCLYYHDFDVAAEKCSIKILHNPQVPIYLKPESPGMRKNIISHCTASVGKTIRTLLDNAAIYDFAPQIYSNLVVIGHMGTFVYFRFEQNKTAARIQRIVDEYIDKRLPNEVTSNVTTPTISPTTSLETNDSSITRDDNAEKINHYSFVPEQESFQNDPFKTKKFD
jgi:hypothetical protein